MILANIYKHCMPYTDFSHAPLLSLIIERHCAACAGYLLQSTQASGPHLVAEMPCVFMIPAGRQGLVVILANIYKHCMPYTALSHAP